MVAISLFLGLFFGGIWGSLFVSRYKKSPFQSANSGSSTWFLASTSVIRYLLLAALLVLLMVKYKILILWWAFGFMVGFWLVLGRGLKISLPSITDALVSQVPTATEGKENDEDSNI